MNSGEHTRLRQSAKGYDKIREAMEKYRDILLVLGLALLTFCAFNTILENDFISFDDPLYITWNDHVQQGLTAASIQWAFTTFKTANWYPLTWLSHMLDVELYGLEPGGHHFTSLVIHLCNVLLLFGWLRYATGAVWRSALVAALFAVHPLRAESVAWASERKDVLSGLFGLLTLWAYVFYARKPDVWRYVYVVIALLLGLMCKAMLVTWPLLMLLLDIWPLRRWEGLSAEQSQGVSWRGLLKEKIPLAAVSGVFCVVAFISQKSENAVISLQTISLPMRGMHVVTAYVRYLGKIFFPYPLALYYPYQSPHLVTFLFCLAVMILLCGIAIWQIRRRPFWAVGWFWFVISLLPVIGLVQIGNQAMADRYTYLPSIGVALVLSWGLSEIAERGRLWRGVAATGVSLFLAAILCLTWIQTLYWKDNLSLYKRTLDVTTDNWVIEQNYIVALKKAGFSDLAEKHAFQVLELHPDDAEVNAFLGKIFLEKKQFSKAETYLRIALQAGFPYLDELYFQLGIACGGQGKYKEAEKFLLVALRIRKDTVPVLYTLADVYRDTGNIRKSMEMWEKILASDPAQTEAMVYLAWEMATASDPNLCNPARMMQYAVQAVEQTHYHSIGAMDALAAAYARQGDFEKAVHYADLAIQKAESESLSGLAADIKKRKQYYEDKKAWVKEPRQEREL